MSDGKVLFDVSLLFLFLDDRLSTLAPDKRDLVGLDFCFVFFFRDQI